MTFFFLFLFTLSGSNLFLLFSLRKRLVLNPRVFVKKTRSHPTYRQQRVRELRSPFFRRVTFDHIPTPKFCFLSLSSRHAFTVVAQTHCATLLLFRRGITIPTPFSFLFLHFTFSSLPACAFFGLLRSSFVGFAIFCTIAETICNLPDCFVSDGWYERGTQTFCGLWVAKNVKITKRRETYSSTLAFFGGNARFSHSPQAGTRCMPRFTSRASGYCHNTRDATQYPTRFDDLVVGNTRFDLFEFWPIVPRFTSSHLFHVLEAINLTRRTTHDFDFFFGISFFSPLLTKRRR